MKLHQFTAKNCMASSIQFVDYFVHITWQSSHWKIMLNISTQLFIIICWNNVTCIFTLKMLKLCISVMNGWTLEQAQVCGIDLLVFWLVDSVGHTPSVIPNSHIFYYHRYHVWGKCSWCLNQVDLLVYVFYSYVSELHQIYLYAREKNQRSRISEFTYYKFLVNPCTNIRYTFQWA